VKRVRIRTQEPTAIERVFTAVQTGDTEKVLELLHPRAEWTPTIWSGERMYRGHEGIHLWLSQFGEDLEHLDIRVQKVEVSGNRGAVLGIVFDTRGSQKFSVKVAWSYEMEDGLLRRGCAHDTWEEALEAAGLAGEPDAPSPPAAADPQARAGGRALGRVRQALRPNPECPVGRHFCRFSRR
jgi:ketosteroid isomerase-like protein